MAQSCTIHANPIFVMDSGSQSLHKSISTSTPINPFGHQTRLRFVCSHNYIHMVIRFGRFCRGGEFYLFIDAIDLHSICYLHVIHQRHFRPRFMFELQMKMREILTNLIKLALLGKRSRAALRIRSLINFKLSIVEDN